MFPDPGGANFFKVDILRKICHFGVILVATLTPLMKNLLEEHPPSLTMTPYHSPQWGPTNSQRRKNLIEYCCVRAYFAIVTVGG